MPRTKNASPAEAAYAQYERVFEIESQLEANATEREQLKAELAAIVGDKVPSKRSTKKAAASGQKSSGKKRGRSKNGAILPFLLRNVSDDKSKPTTLEHLDNANQRLKTPVTTATKPRVVIMQNLSSNDKFFKKAARGQYVLTAAGVKARDEKGSKSEKAPVKSKSKKSKKSKKVVETAGAPAPDGAAASPDPADQKA